MMQKYYLTWIIAIIVMCEHVYSQGCDLPQADECTSELQSLYNETKDQGEDRKPQSKAQICLLGLRAKADMLSTNISKCFQESTESCPGSESGLLQVKTRWGAVMGVILSFCENDCYGYNNIQMCKDKVNLTAVEMGLPSEFCRSYVDGRGECLGYYCAYRKMIFDGLFDSSYFFNYHKNICNSGCENLDETVQELNDCYRFVNISNRATNCSDHRKFHNCLQSKSLCDQYTSMIAFLYNYDYSKEQRTCQDEACRQARTCKAELQRQYDVSLGYHITQQNTTDLVDLCLITLIDEDNKRCYASNIDECTVSPRHPLRVQWTELIRDIHQLCDDDCENVTSVVPKCHLLIDYDVLENKKWSQFCSSHRSATECIARRPCSLASAMLDRIISPDATQTIDSVCTRDCSNLDSLLLRLESCSTHLDQEVPNCGHYDQFESCTKLHEFCAEADDIINFLFPRYNALSARCNPTSSTPELTPHKLTFFSFAVTSYLLFMLFD